MARMLSLAAALLAALPASAAEWTIPRDHPRLLIHRDDLAALRKRCGVAAYRDAGPTDVPFASEAAAFDRIKRLADEIAMHGARPGQLYAPALAHLVLGQVGRRDAYVELVESELARRLGYQWQQDDTVIALDWCWDALAPEVREQVAARLLARLAPLTDQVSPLDHVVFHPCLCNLAAVLTLYNAADADLDRRTRLETLLAGAREYLEGPFVRLWERKGPAPTSSTHAIWAEADAVFAAELWQTGTGRPLWPALADSLGRTCDLHFWAYTGHPETLFGFPCDDGSWAPDRPAAYPAGWPVAVPWVLAARCHSPTARWFLDELASFDTGVLAAPAAEPDRATTDLLAWPRVVYGRADAPLVFREACPRARRIPDGIVVMRSGWAPDAAVVWFNAARPYWRSRQNYSAGHFQLFRAGCLATSSAEDVTFEAAPARGGNAYVGRDAADWDLFRQATIAHNCVTVADPIYRQTRFGEPWPALGNQRLIERDYRLSDPPIDQTDRITGRLVAFETNSFYSYAAADLALAYPPDAVASYSRHLLLLECGVLFVCDEIVTASKRAAATWHLQLPERPELDGRPLSDADRVHGVDNQAGIWRLAENAKWLTTRAGASRLFVRTLLPAHARRRVIGGPATTRVIPAGRLAGRPYCGGSDDSYERRLWPAQRIGGPNAWFRLGDPEFLGPAFGLRSNWGRLDVAPGPGDTSVAFLTALVPADADQTQPPRLLVAPAGKTLSIQIKTPRATWTIRWHRNALAEGRPAATVGWIAAGGVESRFEKDTSVTVEPEAALPAARKTDETR